MKALVLEFSATIACRFPQLELLDGGSLYIEVLDFGDIAFCANVERSGLNSSQKKISLAEMWESEISYSYYLEASHESWMITIEGGMAAEVFSDEGLKLLDLNQAKLQNVILSWAEDGDSPKLVSQGNTLLKSTVFSIEISEEFEEYP